MIEVQLTPIAIKPCMSYAKQPLTTWQDQHPHQPLSCLSPQAEVTAPIVLNAMIEQSSHAAAGQSLLADARAADEAAAAAAALEAAFPTTAVTDAERSVGSALTSLQPQTKKIVFERDLLAARATGIVTGICICICSGAKLVCKFANWSTPETSGSL